MQARKKLARPERDSIRRDSDSLDWGSFELSRSELDLFEAGWFAPILWVRWSLAALKGRESWWGAPAAR